MKTLTLISAIMLMVLCNSCRTGKSTETEKHQSSRANLLQVHNSITTFDIEEPLIHGLCIPYVFDDYFLISDMVSSPQIHLFRNKDFQYITSFATRGQGPGEISGVGQITYDDKTRKLLVTELISNRLFIYSIDSLLNKVPDYKPTIRNTVNKKTPVMEYQLVSDTLAIGTVWNRDIEETSITIARWNPETGFISIMPNHHPELKQQMPIFDVSPQKGIYVNCQVYYDLMTICDLNGNLLYNIYGPHWSTDSQSNRIFYAQRVLITGKYIVALTLSGRVIQDPESKEAMPTTLLVFDLQGNYLKTLDLGGHVGTMCYDATNERLIFVFNEEYQFGYLNLQDMHI